MQRGRSPLKGAHFAGLIFAGFAALALCADVGPGTSLAAPSAQGPALEGYRLVDTWETRRPDLGAVDYENPRGIDVAGDDTIFLVDRSLDRTYHLDATGRVMEDWPSTPAGEAPIDIAAVVDPAVGHRVFVISSRGADIYSGMGTRVGGWAENGLTGIAIGPDRRVYVARNSPGPFGAEAVIDVHDVAGARLETWDDAAFVIIDPHGIDVAPDGTVFLASGDGTVYAWQAGGVKAQLVAAAAILGPEMVDVATDAEGRVFALQRDDRSPANARLVAWDVSAADFDRGGAGSVYIDHVSVPNAIGIAVGPGAGLVITSSDGRFQGISRQEDRSTPRNPIVRWDFADVALGILSAPQRVSTSPSGDVFITDWVIESTPRQELIQRWSSDGRPISLWDVPQVSDVAGGSANPCSLRESMLACHDGSGTAWQVPVPPGAWFAAIDGSATALAAIDLGRQRLILFDRTGMETGGWALPSVAGFAVYSDVALDGDRVYLANRATRSVGVFTTAGVFLADIAVPGGALRIAARDGVLFALGRNGWVWKYDGAGTLLSAWRTAPDSSPSDLAAGPAGRVYIADPDPDDPAAPRVLVYEPGGTPPSSIPDNPSTRCTILADKHAAPALIERGETATITLDVTGDCPQGDGRFDVVLVVDRSGSMEGGKMVAAKNAVISFLGELMPGAAQVALVPFSTGAEVTQPLTPDLDKIVQGLRSIEPIGMTNMRPGLELALAELEGPMARPEVPRIVVLMTDGRPTDEAQALVAAAAVKSSGFTLYTIGLGRDLDADVLRRMASTPELYYPAASELALADVYADIGRRLSVTRLLDTATIVDTVPDDMRYVLNSANPPAAWDPVARTLTWNLTAVPPRGVKLAFEIIPTIPGDRPTNVEATIDYTDVTGATDRLIFPIPRILVGERSLWQAYMPYVSRNTCRPKRADVVLVIDSSSSMNGSADDDSGRTKLEAAVDAARTFMTQMELPEDQASIATFDENARVVQRLTGARGVLETELRRITLGSGTRIDRGIRVAFGELLSPRHIPSNASVMIVLTDGQPSGGSEASTLREARDARAAGIQVYAVGLGSDADFALLSLIAGDHRRAFVAPTAALLRSIYEAIAGEVLCN